ncbi:Alpha/Beta hydrolase protein [Trichoderma ceciliae]
MLFNAYHLLSLLGHAVLAVSSPTAQTVNGTYSGLSISSFSQDAFYGIRYAQAPVGDLRLRRSLPYNQSWSGVRNATVRSDSCPGYNGFPLALVGGSLIDGLTLGEDCLTIDIVRPANVKPGDNLPVFTWFYGGGFIAGGSADPKYNLSYIVRNSMEMNKPIIGAIINYRTMCFGYLASQEVLDAKLGNLGLFDQRQGLRWIQENIQGFGGDPTKVTIAGESAGGSSSGYHLIGFKGNNDGLFRAAIMESASLLGAPINNPEQLQRSYQGMYNNITTTVGCNTSNDSLSCLRTVPFETLYNACIGQRQTPIIDGEFISQLPSESIQKGEIADVAVIMGSNTDECTAIFLGPRQNPLNTDENVFNYIQSLGAGLDNNTVETVMELYPDDPVFGCPFGTGPERFADQGFQYKRGAAIAGDYFIHAGRRFYANSHSLRSQKPIYTYRFDQAPWNDKEPSIMIIPPVQVTHYSEIVYVFDNPNNNSNFIGPYPSYARLQSFVSRSWAAFVHDLNPNNHGLKDPNLPKWPTYNATKPQNMVFREGGSFTEHDDYRKEQLAFWGTIWPELQT